ncbi:MAG: hypothetical protein K0S10_1429 [Rubrobacteraceae bacterium]|nr:hypothetical protein [Rubrobacteraceae bacterium]
MRRVTVDEEGAVSDAGDPAPDQAPWYRVLIRDEVSGLEILTESTPQGEVVLPTFGSAEDACSYLAGGRGSWKPKKTGRGELISLLAGICGEAWWVTLDPPPGMASGEVLEFLGMSRDRFLEPLLGRGRFWFERGHERQGC